MDTINHTADTIAAIATPSGRGSVGIVRVSGPDAKNIAETICARPLTARYAHYLKLHQPNKQPGQNALIDEGVVLYFKAPRSFTGEDVVEFQAHGGPVVLQLLLEAVCYLGARLARPGEFTERAYHNDKLDLAQAEAVADLINAETKTAARRAQANLSGEFSKQANQLAATTLRLRMYIESAIDFPEEEIDFLSDSSLTKGMNDLAAELALTLSKAETGRRLQQGSKIALSGAPNAGKSSLLNALTEKDSAIVTDIAGTTRDTLHEHIAIEGIPIELVDTAGLRETEDVVEQAGIDRALRAVNDADMILWVVDATQIDRDALLNIANWHSDAISASSADGECFVEKRLLVINKIDLLADDLQTQIQQQDQSHPLAGLGVIACSAQTKQQLATLKKTILAHLQVNDNLEDAFLARERHVQALKTAQLHICRAQDQLQHGAGEIAAEECRLAHEALFSLTGKVTQDDLLGEIFSSFCIGK